MNKIESELTVDRKLSEIFEEAFDLFNSFETCNDPTNSPEFQANIRRCIKLFEDCTRLVSVCGLFSSNEKYTELPTNDLKYFLLPFFLGILSQKLCSGKRSDIVDVADTYFKDFLKRCSEYELYDSLTRPMNKQPELPDDPHIALTEQVIQRNRKLESYRQKKELQDNLKQLKIAMNREEIDEETTREFFIKLIKVSTFDAQEEITSLEQENQILEYQQKYMDMCPQDRREKQHVVSAPKKLQPIIITKDLAQKAIYGIGYPSIPTMTVSEFYDQRVREGIFPDTSKRTPNVDKMEEQVMRENAIEQEDIEREAKLEIDDDYEVARLRARDEYKDEHRRGEGNRYNRS